MKSIIKTFMSFLLAVTLVSCSATSAPQETKEESKEEKTETAVETKFKAGTYEGESAGFGGESKPIKVTVTLSDETIDKIEYTADGETPTVGGAALPTLVEDVLAAQSTQIDGQTGATVTSNGFFEAVNQALEADGVDPSSLEP